MLTNNSQHCRMLQVASVCTPCFMLLDVVACCCAKFETCQTFQPTTLNISLFRDRRSVTQQCWICLHSSSNIVGATHAHYTRFTKTYGLCPSHDALQVPTLLGVVAPFAHHCQHGCNNSQHCWRNNVGSCCVRRLHAPLRVVRSCCICSHTTANTDATTPNHVGSCGVLCTPAPF